MPVEDGWTWKFDANALGARRFGEPFREYLQAVRCRPAPRFGENSALVSRHIASYNLGQQQARRFDRHRVIESDRA